MGGEGAGGGGGDGGEGGGEGGTPKQKFTWLQSLYMTNADQLPLWLKNSPTCKPNARLRRALYRGEGRKAAEAGALQPSGSHWRLFPHSARSLSGTDCWCSELEMKRFVQVPTANSDGGLHRCMGSIPRIRW